MVDILFSVLTGSKLAHYLIWKSEVTSSEKAAGFPIKSCSFPGEAGDSFLPSTAQGNPLRLPGNLKPRMSMVSIADEEELVEIDEGSRTPPTPRKSTSLSESSTTALETATCWILLVLLSNVCVCMCVCVLFFVRGREVQHLSTWKDFLDLYPKWLSLSLFYKTYSENGSHGGSTPIQPICLEHLSTVT